MKAFQLQHNIREFVHSTDEITALVHQITQGRVLGVAKVRVYEIGVVLDA